MTVDELIHCLKQFHPNFEIEVKSLGYHFGLSPIMISLECVSKLDELGIPPVQYKVIISLDEE